MRVARYLRSRVRRSSDGLENPADECLVFTWRVCRDKNEREATRHSGREGENGKCKCIEEKQRCFITHTPPTHFTRFLTLTRCFSPSLAIICDTQLSDSPSFILEARSYSTPSEPIHSIPIIHSSTRMSNHRHSSIMGAAVNYTDSYDASSSAPLKRAGSTRQYASSLHRTQPMQARPVFIATTKTSPSHFTSSIVSNDTYDISTPLLDTSRRLHSSTSLSSTGYDSNSSPSIKSKRNSVATNNSNDFITQSTCSSSSSSSNDERQDISTPWVSGSSRPRQGHREQLLVNI